MDQIPASPPVQPGDPGGSSDSACKGSTTRITFEDGHAPAGYEQIAGHLVMCNTTSGWQVAEDTSGGKISYDRAHHTVVLARQPSAATNPVGDWRTDGTAAPTFTIVSEDEDGKPLRGMELGGQSCTRVEEDLTWDCEDLSDYSWTDMTFRSTDSHYLDQIPTVGACGQPEVIQVRLRQEHPAPGYEPISGEVVMCVAPNPTNPYTQVISNTTNGQVTWDPLRQGLIFRSKRIAATPEPTSSSSSSVPESSSTSSVPSASSSASSSTSASSTSEAPAPTASPNVDPVPTATLTSSNEPAPSTSSSPAAPSAGASSSSAPPATSSPAASGPTSTRPTPAPTTSTPSETSAGSSSAASPEPTSSPATSSSAHVTASPVAPIEPSQPAKPTHVSSSAAVAPSSGAANGNVDGGPQSDVPASSSGGHDGIGVGGDVTQGTVAGHVPSGATGGNISTGNPGHASTSWTLVVVGATLLLLGAGVLVGVRRRMN